MVVLLDLLDQESPLLVLAPLVLEPHSDDTGVEACHLHQLVLHQRIRPGVGSVAGLQHMQLLLIQHRPHSRRFAALLPALGALVAVLCVRRSGWRHLLAFVAEICGSSCGFCECFSELLGGNVLLEGTRKKIVVVVF